MSNRSLSFSSKAERDMEEEYDTDAFVIFTIAMVSIYILLASIFLYKRLRRFFSKEPVVCDVRKGLRM